MRRYAALSILFFQCHLLNAQRDLPIRKRMLQLSIAPGLGTNGTQPGSYENYFSINATSGYSASNLLLEIATLSNLNINHTIGLQFAGLCNITGANAFAGMTKKEREQKINSGFSSYLNGIQVSGLTNLLLGDANGSQFTGGMNIVKGHLLGMQLAGFGNVVYKFSFGVQAAGMFNVSMASMSGVQLSIISNYTRGEMAGVQISLVNQAGDIQGPNTYEQTESTGFQIGLFNRARKMDGYQIGLINFTERSQGTQLGVINFCKGGRQIGTKDGTAVGLVNIGGSGYAAAYASEIFVLNYEISTGTRKNAIIAGAKRNVYLTNSILYSHKALRSEAWALGYGLRKVYFNKSELPGMAESNFFGFALDGRHVNWQRGEFTRDFSLLASLKIIAGKRIARKLSGVNWYASIDANAFAGEGGSELAPPRLSSETTFRGIDLTVWPGFSFGILCH